MAKTWVQNSTNSNATFWTVTNIDPRKVTNPTINYTLFLNDLKNNNNNNNIEIEIRHFENDSSYYNMMKIEDGSRFHR